MEFGISTFGEIVPEKVSGKAVNANKKVQELLQYAKLADEIGLDVFALGEHHRADYVVSSPEMILAAAASITQKIKFISAVTVLSSADPVRVFQNFATLDLVSNGRAEIMAGRGSFIESFPLFGYDLNDYDELFAEKLELLLNINQHEIVFWKGTHRASINNLGVYPRPLQQQLPIWIAVGGTPASVVRAGSLNLPLTLAILGGNPAQFTQFTNLYRNAAKKAGHDVSKLQVCINEHTYLADSSEEAKDEFWVIYEKVMNKIGRERGWSKMTRDHFEALCEPDGPLIVGSVNDVTEKLIYQHKLFGNTRFLAQIISGDIPHEKMLHSIELFGKEVVPAVKKAIQSPVILLWMVTPEEAKQIALSFEGTDEKPHFHRTAFTVNKKIFATLLARDSTLNLMFDLQTQFIFCPPNSDVIYPVPNKWGLKGATTINLKKANKKLVKSALNEAYQLRKSKNQG